MNPNQNGGQNPYGYSQPDYSQPQYPTAQQIPAPQPSGQSSSIFQAPPAKSGPSLMVIIVMVILILLFIGAGSAAIWAYGKYMTAHTNVQSQIEEQVAAAKNEQANKDEDKFLEREKQPNKQFVGPDNYGRVTFDYPKTWSAYAASNTDSNGGTYQAYLNPGVVPPTDGDSPVFALRVTIQQQTMQQALQQYQGQIQSGQMTSSSFSANGHNGTRVDGNFTPQMRGAAVLLQIRDKVLIVQTDANTFLPDFNNIIKTINFNS